MRLPFGIGRFGLGTLAAVVGTLVASLLAVLNLYLTHVLVRTLPIVLATACLLYLLVSRGPDQVGTATLPRWCVHALPSVVFLGTTALIFLSVRTGGRGPAFYALAAVVAVSVFVQIAFTADRDLHVGVLLSQVLVLGFVVRFAGLLGSAGYVGVDVWIHVPQYVEGILATNSLEGMGQTKYVAAPLYHLLVAATVLLTDLSTRLALFVSLGTAMAMSVLFVHVTASMFVDPRWAVFAVAAYSISDFVVVWSIHLIPTSFGLIVFLAVLFLFVRLQRRDATQRETALMVALIVTMAFTHQVSAFIMFVLLVSGSIAQLLLNADGLRRRLSPRSGRRPSPRKDVRPRNVHGYSVFALGVLVLAWSRTPWGDQTFTEAAVEVLWGSIQSSGLFDRSDAAGASGVDEGTLLGETIIPLIDHLGFLLLAFGTVIGILYVLQRDRTNQSKVTFIVATAVMCTFTLVPPLFGLDNFLPGRWFAFLYATMVLLTVIGFDGLRKSADPQVFAVVVLAFVLLFSGSAMFATEATQDDPAFPEENTRYGYTPTETAAMETVVDVTEEEIIYTDHPYTTALNRYGGEYRFAPATVDEDPPGHETVLYREYQTTGAPQFQTEEGDPHVEQVSAAEMCGPRSIGYDNGDAVLCTR